MCMANLCLTHLWWHFQLWHMHVHSLQIGSRRRLWEWTQGQHGKLNEFMELLLYSGRSVTYRKGELAVTWWVLRKAASLEHTAQLVVRSVGLRVFPQKPSSPVSSPAVVYDKHHLCFSQRWEAYFVVIPFSSGKATTQQCYKVCLLKIPWLSLLSSEGPTRSLVWLKWPLKLTSRHGNI